MTPREIRFGIDGLTGIVIVSVAAALASLTWRLAGASGSDSPVGAAVDAYVRPAPPPDISGMINLPPFGRAMVAQAAAAESSLILHGVLLANPAPASSALIAPAKGQESAPYRIGDPLPTGAILERIGVDYVILNRGGQFYTLYFPDDPRAGKTEMVAQAPGGAGNAQSQAQAREGVAAIRALLPRSVLPPEPGPQQPTAPPPPPPPPPAGTQPPAPGTPQNSSSGNALIDSLGATVTAQGYRVGPALSPQLRQAGLAPGDVVASVNGVSASALAANPGRLAQMMASGQARVEVLRGDDRVTVSVPLR